MCEERVEFSFLDDFGYVDDIGYADIKRVPEYGDLMEMIPY